MEQDTNLFLTLMFIGIPVLLTPEKYGIWVFIVLIPFAIYFNAILDGYELSRQRKIQDSNFLEEEAIKKASQNN